LRITGAADRHCSYDPIGGELSEVAARALAWEGRFLVIGFASGTIPKLPLNIPLLKSTQIVGVFWGMWLAREPAAAKAQFEELCALHRDKHIRLEPHIISPSGPTAM